MAFDIQPPKKVRPKPPARGTAESVKVRQVQKAAPVKNVQPQAPVRPVKAVRLHPPKKRGGKAGLIFSLIIILIALGAGGYYYWQNFLREEKIDQQPTKAGVVETFNDIELGVDNADKPKVTETSLQQMQNLFNENINLVQPETFVAQEFDESDWEEINDYINSF